MRRFRGGLHLQYTKSCSRYLKTCHYTYFMIKYVINKLNYFLFKLGKKYKYSHR